MVIVVVTSPTTARRLVGTCRRRAGPLSGALARSTALTRARASLSAAAAPPPAPAAAVELTPPGREEDIRRRATAWAGIRFDTFFSWCSCCATYSATLCKTTCCSTSVGDKSGATAEAAGGLRQQPSSCGTPMATMQSSVSSELTVTAPSLSCYPPGLQLNFGELRRREPTEVPRFDIIIQIEVFSPTLLLFFLFIFVAIRTLRVVVVVVVNAKNTRATRSALQ